MNQKVLLWKEDVAPLPLKCPAEFLLSHRYEPGNPFADPDKDILQVRYWISLVLYILFLFVLLLLVIRT